MFREMLVIAVSLISLCVGQVATLDGVHNVIINIYDSPSGGALIQTETLSGIRFHDGIPSPDMFDTVRERVTGYDEVYLEISIDGEALGGGRISLPIEPALRRDTAPDDAGETTESLETRLRIGWPGEDLLITADKVGFGTDSPHASAYVDVFSTESGFLIPRMTTALRDAITSPAQGLLIYNIDDDCFNYSTGFDWLELCGSCLVPEPAGTITGTSPVCQGDEGIAYEVSAIDGATSYVWSFTGTGFSIADGAGTNSILADFSPTATSGNITVYGVNDCGSGTPSPAFDIIVESPPEIITNPTNQSVDAGESATFTVTASGAGLSYQWQVNDGDGWTNIGLSSPSYNTGATTADMDGFRYRCIITGICGPPITSSEAILSVYSGSGEITFSYTGSMQSWTVPGGVTSITVDAYGAEGGGAMSCPTIGGRGGRVQATLTVTPGDLLHIFVGGRGGNGADGIPGEGGFNGGGTGGLHHMGSATGGGGGGASDIRRGGSLITDRIIVAAGGGGGGRNMTCNDFGGVGGGLIGGTGGASGDDKAGTGGTQTEGGIGGRGFSGAYGDHGGFGFGGNAVTVGGGGGAGYYAGGGSSWVTTSGSSSITHTPDTRTGDGQITISW